MSSVIGSLLAFLTQCTHTHTHTHTLVTTGSEEDLEYYVREAGRVVGVTGKLAQEKRSAKHVLEHVFAQLVEFKKLNQVYTVCT